MIEDGDVEYLCCDRLTEGSLSRVVSRDDSSTGYGPKLGEFFDAVLPRVRDRDITVVGSFGMANPEAAGRKVREVAERNGYSDVTVATITGDDVLSVVDDEDFDPNAFDDSAITGKTPPLDTDEVDLLAAQAYLGIEPIVEALDGGADVVVGGRLSDTAIYAGVLAHEFGWEMDDWDRLARGYVVGHLLECGRYATGGNLASPGYVDVPDMDELGLPLAEVSEDGDAVVSKPVGTGGVVSELSLAAQLLYEVEDPANYYQPDVVVDMREVTLEEVGDDRVRVSGAKGKPRPEMLKVNVAADGGYLAEVESSFAGPDSYAKAQMHVEEIYESRLTDGGENVRDVVDVRDYRIDLIGVDSIFGAAAPEPECDPNEVRIRIAARVADERSADRFCEYMAPEVYTGPVGAGGIRTMTNPQTEVYSTLVSREYVTPTVTYETPRESADEPETGVTGR